MTERRAISAPAGARMFWISIGITATALIVAMSVLIALDYVARRNDLGEDLRTRAFIVGENAAATITFNDAVAAGELLAALRTSPDVLAAGIYRDQQVFATYFRDVGSLANRLPQSAPQQGQRFESGMLEVVEPVFVKEQRVGEVLLRADTSRIRASLIRYGFSAITILCLAFAAAYFLLARMRRHVVSAEENLAFMAHYDSITGLPNRNGFLDILGKSIGRASRSKYRVALLFLDLDNFKLVNDSLGHEAGDHLLAAVAERITGRLRVSDVVSRLGGDEFTIILENVKGAEHAGTVARSIVDEISKTFSIQGHEVFVGASVGISLYPDDGDTVPDLVRNADTAMYRAKEAGKRRFTFFTPEMNRDQQQRFAIENGLRRALEDGGFYLVYQPQISLETGEVVGLEVLLRWNHPEFGKQSPALYLGIAESSDLIEHIGDWVLRAACQQVRQWLEAGLPAVRVAVNLSVRQLRRKGFADHVKVVLDGAGLPASLLELEVTETVLMEDPEATANQLHRLRDMGVTTAIDDFGTGFSSMMYLRRLPVRTLKIDKVFVRDIANSPEDAMIARAIIGLADNLRMRTIAEGVESAEALECLREMGCWAVQGYFTGRPLTADRIPDLLRARSSRSDPVVTPFPKRPDARPRQDTK